jgi:hypothetical protein
MTAAGTDVAKTDPTLITDLQNFAKGANDFAHKQEGLFQARFDNELDTNSVAGTAVRELVTGLTNHDSNLTNGAATVLAQNAMDIQGNNQFNGIDIGTSQPVQANGGPPAPIDVHTAGLYFDDAATKLIGGVYSGNQASVLTDLKATIAGMQNAINNQPLTGQALTDAQHVIQVANHEIGLVTGINTANPTPVSMTNSQIGTDQADILHTVNNDATLANLANGSFTANPPVTFPVPGGGFLMAQNQTIQNAQGQGMAMNGQGQGNQGQGNGQGMDMNAQGQQGQAAAAQTAANPAPAADHLAAMVDAAMANLTSPPAAMTAAAAGANIPAAANPAPAALSAAGAAAGPAAADHAALDMAHHSFLDNNHISTAHDQFHHIWG